LVGLILNIMKITFISDTHNKHNQITEQLSGGDLLIHAGDISSMGYEHEIRQFCKWFDKLDNYNVKVFIAGNHDWGFQENPEKTMEIVNSYKSIDYLQDSFLGYGKDVDNYVKIYGSPWQPEFHHWAFNSPKNGEELEQKWNDIPEDVDILITHGPAFGYLDKSGPPHNEPLLGCELLVKKIKQIKPKIHVCGHIHGGYGYVFDGDTHFINASVLNEQYYYVNKPLTVEWNPTDNSLEFL
jgi:Icc-related predicted phosphoesterase